MFLIGPNSGQDLAIVYVKILLNYLQIINVISQLQYKLFSDLNIFSSVGNPIQSSLTSLDCALKNMDRNIFPIVYIRIIWVVLLYFVYSILISKINKNKIIMISSVFNYNFRYNSNNHSLNTKIINLDFFIPSIHSIPID